MSKQLNILVVDDDAENAESIAELFSADNHRVIVAYNGQQAIDAYAANDFDVGFFDVMMPVKNGVESFLEIRKFNPQAKVYFMTGFSESDLLDRAKAGGALGVFSKPTNP
ncbi:MAG: response regulator, partial [Alphaproteobacteria bacterium]|nr:response regulator [Alphaproteobacteria bacterium]